MLIERPQTSDDIPDAADVVVVGAGVAGLTCAGILAHYGLEVAVVEAHSKAGGCAHTWSRAANGQRFDFDVGTSLFFGFRERPSDNPIAAVLDLLDVQDIRVDAYPESKTALFFPEGSFRTQVGHAANVSTLPINPRSQHVAPPMSAHCKATPTVSM